MCGTSVCVERARRYAITSVRPSPARVDAPEPDVWIPILDLELLEALGSQIDPVLLRELEGLERSFLEPPAPEPTPKVGLPAPPETGPSGAPEPPEPAVAPAVAGRHRHHRFLHAVILAVALAVVAAGLPYFLRSPAQRRVTLHVDGATFTRTTGVDDVAGLLAAAGVALAPGDRVIPAPGAPLHAGATVRVVRSFPVTVDVDGKLRTVRTTARTVERLRRALDLPTTLVTVAAPRRLHDGDAVVFRTAFDLTLVTDGVAGSLTTTARTVGELLAERGVGFAPGDRIDPPPETALAPGVVITLTHVTADRVAADVPVASDVPEQPDPSVPVAAPPVAGSFSQSGVATWYATLHRPGTCAHLTLPFGTTVRLTDTDTGATATCTVADRGPEAWTGNVIDLSPDVFEQLRPLSTGEVHVRIDA